MSILGAILEMLARVCLMIVVTYLVSRMRFFKEVIDKEFNPANRILLILVFGLLSIYGTYTGFTLESGAWIDLRDTAPIVAGLIGGPLVGLGTGLIGGIYRLSLEGTGAGAYAIATVVIGLASGIIYNIRRGQLMSMGGTILLAAIAECFTLAMVLLIARPFDQALIMVKQTAIPLILANAIGTGLIMGVIKSLAANRQKKTGEN